MLVSKVVVVVRVAFFLFLFSLSSSAYRQLSAVVWASTGHEERRRRYRGEGRGCSVISHACRLACSIGVDWNLRNLRSIKQS
jgi:hypothetical protein